MNKDEKKWFLIKIIGCLILLIAGATFGLISASMCGWDFVTMMKDPKVWLALLCVLALLVTMFSFKKVK